jgi:sigma-B regulation protein RsbU (phosphoserine phosphatase)
MSALASVLAVNFFKKHFVSPVQAVSNEAVRFAAENTKGEPLGAISRFDEISGLALSIDAMETKITEYIRYQTAVAAEEERLGTELSLARTIQENAVPNVFPAFPDRDEFDVYATMTPAKGVGGDFYNFFLIDDDHLAVMLGDVSGKGIPASLFMMEANLLLSDRTAMGGTPAEILVYVNDRLCTHNKAEMFVTLWLGILELSTGRMTAANAGHEFPALKSPDGGFALMKDSHGFVLGGMEGQRYRDYTFTLEPGTKLFIYSDGVPEASDAEDRMFGLDRMLSALNRDPEAEPKQILQTVRNAVNDFVQAADQFDDLTMLCLEYRGQRNG